LDLFQRITCRSQPIKQVCENHVNLGIGMKELFQTCMLV